MPGNSRLCAPPARGAPRGQRPPEPGLGTACPRLRPRGNPLAPGSLCQTWAAPPRRGEPRAGKRGAGSTPLLFCWLWRWWKELPEPSLGSFKVAFRWVWRSEFLFPRNLAASRAAEARLLCGCLNQTSPPPRKTQEQRCKRRFYFACQTEINCSRREGRKKGGAATATPPLPPARTLTHSVRPGRSWKKPVPRGQPWPRLC